MVNQSDLLTPEDYLKNFEKIEAIMHEHRKMVEEKFKIECNLIQRSFFFLHYATYVRESDKKGFKTNLNAQCMDALLLRNISFLKSAYFQTLYGWYIPARAALRSAYEDWLVMEYLLINPARTEDFLKVSGFSPEDKDKPENQKLSREFLPRNLVRVIFGDEKERKEYSKFYRILCDYAHPTMKGVLWEERFSEQNSRDNLLLILELTSRTIDSFFKHGLFRELIQGDLRYASVLEGFMNEVIEHLEAKRNERAGG